jgi:hypothetical protein
LDCKNPIGYMARRPRDVNRLLAPPPRRQPLHTRPVVVAASSAVLGFVTGAIFWHSIGFWSFVSTVVLKGPDDEVRTVQAATTAPVQVPVHMRPTGSIGPQRPVGRPSTPKSYLTCSLAVADETLGETQVLPCPPGTLAAPSKPLARKGDLLTAAASEPAAPTQIQPAPQPLTFPSAVATPAPAPGWSPIIRGAQR